MPIQQYDTTNLYDSATTYNAGGASGSGGEIYEIQQSLSILAGVSSRPFLEAQKAANVWAGSTGLDLQAALNFKIDGHAGGTRDIQQAANVLNGTLTMDTQDALSELAGGGHTNAL